MLISGFVTAFHPVLPGIIYLVAYGLAGFQFP